MFSIINPGANTFNVKSTEFFYDTPEPSFVIPVFFLVQLSDRFLPDPTFHDHPIRSNHEASPVRAEPSMDKDRFVLFGDHLQHVDNIIIIHSMGIQWVIHQLSSTSSIVLAILLLVPEINYRANPERIHIQESCSIWLLHPMTFIIIAVYNCIYIEWYKYYSIALSNGAIEMPKL